MSDFALSASSSSLIIAGLSAQVPGVDQRTIAKDSR